MQTTFGINEISEIVKIKISSKSCRELFEGCSLKYILKVCHGRCCSAPAMELGFAVVVLQEELAVIQSHGGVVINNVLQPKPGEKRCPFFSDNGLCNLHESGNKPYGCWLSPFTINKNNTLVIKNRNRMLKCYQDESVAKTPAYIAYRKSLDMMFGEEESAKICQKLDDGSGDFYADMPRINWEKVVTIRNTHHKVVLKK